MNGNVTIQKPNKKGVYETATWDTKCQQANGSVVNTSTAPVTSTQAQVVMSGGTGSINSDGSVNVSWTGGFTAVFYGGMTYWSAQNPVLTIDVNGNGKLTAEASGYGADMDNADTWKKLPTQTITLATLSGVNTAKAQAAGGFTVTPNYLGVKVSGSGIDQAAKDATNKSYWGSFPKSFVEFQVKAGQNAYWYTSGGARDVAKPATPLTVAFTSKYKIPAVSVATSSASDGSSGTSDTFEAGSTTGDGTNNAATAGEDEPVEATEDGTIFSRSAEQTAPQTIVTPKDTALRIAIASGGVGLAALLPLFSAFAIRRFLGLAP